MIQHQVKFIQPINTDICYLF